MRRYSKLGELIRLLRITMMPRIYPCPCCGYVVFKGPPGSYDVCPICYWEDCAVDLNWFFEDGGVNVVNLVQAQNNYESFGAMEERFMTHVRLPKRFERREVDWRKIDLARDVPGQMRSVDDYYWRKN